MYKKLSFLYVRALLCIEFSYIYTMETIQRVEDIIKKRYAKNAVCKKCGAPMFDDFTNSFHDEENCEPTAKRPAITYCPDTA